PEATPAATPAGVASAPVVDSTPARRKPAPSRRERERHEQVAENREPVADPMPVQMQAPAVATPVPPLDPTPPPHPAVVLNPPPMAQTAPPEPRQPHNATIPAGALITVRLADSLSSSKNHAGDAFSATLDQPLVVDGFAVAERGAHIEGRVIDTGQNGKDLALQLIKLHTSDGQDVPITTERVTRQGSADTGKQTGEKVGAGAVLGAVIGAIAGGGKGAAIGAGAGGAAGGGVAAATHRKATELPVETRLSFRLAQPVKLTERVE
ncbi:MAG TPA: hypothetical protein VN893_19520, partial [Bryobacteraceae bacterium]|nr:hypothetical protein [Bryobacteraceae bacterium]